MKTGENTTENKNENEGMPAWVLPILSALGSMGGSYMLWVKPLQDSFKAMSERVEELRAEIKTLKQQAGRERQALNGIEDEDDENGLLQNKRLRPLQSGSKKRSTISIK